MTQEEKKDLLFRDLCARLPYGVKVHHITDGVIEVESIDKEHINDKYPFHSIKPYLRPMSNMTDEEKKEFVKEACYERQETVNGYHYEYYWADYCGDEKNPIGNYYAIDWLLANHLDFRGLIEQDSAIDCTDLDIY